MTVGELKEYLVQYPDNDIIIQQPYLEYTTGHADTLCYGRVDTLDVLKGH